MKTRLATLSAIVIALMLTPLALGVAFAMPISPVSYDMINGGSGSFNYWDNTYNGTGSNTTNYAQLSGGRGDLTDGIIATKSIGITPSLYVGWAINPTITFNFGELVNIDSITLYLDDRDGINNINLPASVTLIMGDSLTTHAVINPPTTTPIPVTLSNLGLSGDILSLPLNRLNNTKYRGWVFLSEVEFDGAPVVKTSLAAAPVPEPGTMLLLGAGLFGLAFYSKRRRGGN